MDLKEYINTRVYKLKTFRLIKFDVFMKFHYNILNVYLWPMT